MATSTKRRKVTRKTTKSSTPRLDRLQRKLILLDGQATTLDGGATTDPQTIAAVVVPSAFLKEIYLRLLVLSYCNKAEKVLDDIDRVLESETLTAAQRRYFKEKGEKLFDDIGRICYL